MCENIDCLKTAAVCRAEGWVNKIKNSIALSTTRQKDNYGNQNTITSPMLQAKRRSMPGILVPHNVT